MSSLRVAITAEQILRPTPGGIGTYTEQLLRAYRRNFGAPIVLSSRPSASLRRVLNELGDARPTHFGAHITGRLWERDFARLSKSLRDIDVLHATSFHYPDVHARASKTHPRLSVFVHDLAWIHHPEFFSPRGRSFHDRGLNRTVRHADWILVPSERTKTDLINIAGICGERITVVGEGADHLPPADPQRRKRHRPYLLTVSTIEPRKNLSGLLRAYEIVRGHVGSSCPDLVVVGAQGWNGSGGNAQHAANLLAATQNDAATIGVEFLGGVSAQRLSDLYADALAFAYVPHLEGFGLPPIEAMRAGVAVVASNAVPSVDTGSVNVAADKRPALTVTAEDTIAIANALQRFVEDRQCREDYARRGFEFAQQFTWDDVAQRHHEIWLAGITGERP
jgi:glycosyltransferase involved in cell wall biosynthesis